MSLGAGVLLQLWIKCIIRVCKNTELLWILAKTDGGIRALCPAQRPEEGIRYKCYKSLMIKEEQEMLRIGFLTSGGDCQALSGVLRI